MSERQMSDTPEISHVTRYLFAASRIRRGSEILDVFCGTGYGAQYLSVAGNVTAFDRYDGKPKNCVFKCLEYPFKRETFKQHSFDAMTCFEAIEHVPFTMAKQLLADMAYWIKPGGQLFISSPNQERYPFDPDRIKHHFFHFTWALMQTELEQSGFDVREWWCQESKGSARMIPGVDGRYILASCVAR